MRACDYSVYVIHHMSKHHIRYPTYGGMDSEPTGRYEDVEHDYIVVAPNEAFALTAFNRYHKDDKVVTIVCIGACSDIVRLQ